MAFGLLGFVGVHMIRSANEGTKDCSVDSSRGWMLLTLAIVPSIDALAVGLGLAALHVSICFPAMIIGIVTMLIEPPIH